MSTVAAVTGATGRIGQALVTALLERGYQVRALTRRPRPSRQGIEWIPGDLGDRDAIASMIRGSGIVFHAGGQLEGDPALIHRSLVEGTANVLRAAGSTMRVVHLSSLVVLDTGSPRSPSTINESSPLEPDPSRRGCYSQAKVEAEALARQAAAVQDVVIIRPGIVVTDEAAPAMPLSIGVAAGRWVLLVGPARAALPVVHVNDVASGLLQAATALPRGEILHLVDPARVSRIELFRRFNDGSRRALDVSGIAKPVARLVARIPRGTAANTSYRMLAAGVPHAWDTSRALSLGWKPDHLDRWLAGASIG
jgi:nucleoside-diphosphate-sugar epimerase